MIATRIIGSAGTGKTTKLLDIVEASIAHCDIMEIGFVSYSKTACIEAATRAEDRFGLHPGELTQFGFFQTIHATCYRAMGRPPCLGGGKKTQQWFAEHMKTTVKMDSKGKVDTSTPAGELLDRWNIIRLRMDSDVLGALGGRSERLEWLDLYERQKFLTNHVDFIDMLAGCAGVKFSIRGPTDATIDAEFPRVRVWIHDEMQDASRLAGMAFANIVEGSGAEEVYLAGDPFQAIHTYSGSDPSVFMGWPVDRVEVMPKSWRCSTRIYALGESCIADCEDYFDRQVVAASVGGEVSYTSVDLSQHSTGIAEIGPDEEWLILARANRQAQALARTLRVPYTLLDGSGGWAGPVERKVVTALNELRCGRPIDAMEFMTLVNRFNTTVDGEAIFERGVKTKWKHNLPGDYRDQLYMLDDLYQFGVTDHFMSLVRSGRLLEMEKNHPRILYAINNFPSDILNDPIVKVGSIHSAKGMEADNVALLLNVSGFVAEKCDIDEERRLAYVGVTRARHRLLLLKGINGGAYAHNYLPVPSIAGLDDIHERYAEPQFEFGANA